MCVFEGKVYFVMQSFFSFLTLYIANVPSKTYHSLVVYLCIYCWQLSINIDIGLFKMFSHWILGFFNMIGGTNSCKLCVTLKLKAYLIFISGILAHSVSHY